MQFGIQSAPKLIKRAGRPKTKFGVFPFSFHTFQNGFFSILLILFACDFAIGQQNWEHWRGPKRNGIAQKQSDVPTKWSETENVKWKTKVPGRGHSSPIVLDQKIYITTADSNQNKKYALAYDLKNGKQLWKTEIHSGGFQRRINRNNSHASSTIATNGKVLFSVFCHNNATWLTKLDLNGKIISKKEIGKYQSRFPFGFGSSPIVFKELVIVPSESDGESFIKAYNIETGKIKWEINRPKMTSYSTPVIAKIGNKEHLLISGGRTVCSYEPYTGKKNWQTSARWMVSCGTMVWNDKLVFTSGGFPASQTIAINASNGKIVWQNRVKMYEQSMLYHDGALYAHSDNGRIYCWDANNGEELWNQRVETRVSASPILVGDNIFFTTERGNTYVVKASKSDYELVNKNKLGDSGFASIAAVNGNLITRVGSRKGSGYQEWLYCLGKNGKQ